ncbi:hypothetical protein ES703_58956 [subsurface metagenome]
MKKQIVLCGVALTAMLLLTLVIGCQQAGGVITKAHAATMELQSYRVFSFTTYTYETKTVDITWEIEFAAPDRHHGKVTIDGEVIEVIIIGDKQYTREPRGSKTVVAATKLSFPRKEDTVELLNQLTDLEKLPDERIESVDYLRYRGKIDVERIAEEQKAKLDPKQLGYEQILKDLDRLRNMKTEVELWIGKDDYLIRQVKQYWEAPTLEPTSGSTEQEKWHTANIMWRYYDLNEPIIIEPPLDAHGELLPGWCLASSPSAETFFYCETHSEITGEDPAHQQISLSVTITNVGMEAAATNVQVDLRNNATIKGDKEESWINAEPSTSGPVSLEPGESETYSVSWEYDASHITREELVELLEQTVIRIAYITPEGNEAVRMYSVGGAPYPSAIPPERPPG